MMLDIRTLCEMYKSERDDNDFIGSLREFGESVIAIDEIDAESDCGLYGDLTGDYSYLDEN